MGFIKLFSYLYDKMVAWSGHRHAPYYLAGVSFAESSFFPLPPDIMLITMGLALPKYSWRYAAIATLFSVLGGILGYWIGMYCMSFFAPFLNASYAQSFAQAQQWFAKSSIWLVILAGFTPFPYKIFTVTAGAMHMSFLPFVLGSLMGRGGRFFLVSTILYFAGATLQKHLRLYIDRIGWTFLFVLIIGYCFLKLY